MSLLAAPETDNDVEALTADMTRVEETMFHRARRAERLATAFGAFFWTGDTRTLTANDWFDAADAIGSLMPSEETRAATMALLDVEQGLLDRRPPEGDRNVARTYYTVRKAARLAQELTRAGVRGVEEITAQMWRDARIGAGLTSNEAPSDVTRAAVAGILLQRTTWW